MVHGLAEWLNEVDRYSITAAYEVLEQVAARPGKRKRVGQKGHSCKYLVIGLCYFGVQIACPNCFANYFGKLSW
jgi:hypothetical protein